jgi:hypothetical protein
MVGDELHEVRVRVDRKRLQHALRDLGTSPRPFSKGRFIFVRAKP